MRRTLLLTLLPGLLLAGCSMAAPRSAGQRQAVRANAISNKHILTEQPTLEHAAPRVAPDSGGAAH